MRPLPPAPADYDAQDQQAVREIIREDAAVRSQQTTRYVVPTAAVIAKSTTVTAADTLAQTQAVLAQLLRDLQGKGVIS